MLYLWQNWSYHIIQTQLSLYSSMTTTDKSDFCQEGEWKQDEQPLDKLQLQQHQHLPQSRPSQQHQHHQQTTRRQQQHFRHSQPSLHLSHRQPPLPPQQPQQSSQQTPTQILQFCHQLQQRQQTKHMDSLQVGPAPNGLNRQQKRDDGWESDEYNINRTRGRDFENEYYPPNWIREPHNHLSSNRHLTNKATPIPEVQEYIQPNATEPRQSQNWNTQTNMSGTSLLLSSAQRAQPEFNNSKQSHPGASLNQHICLQSQFSVLERPHRTSQSTTKPLQHPRSTSGILEPPTQPQWGAPMKFQSPQRAHSPQPQWGVSTTGQSPPWPQSSQQPQWDVSQKPATHTPVQQQLSPQLPLFTGQQSPTNHQPLDQRWSRQTQWTQQSQPQRISSQSLQWSPPKSQEKDSPPQLQQYQPQQTQASSSQTLHSHLVRGNKTLSEVDPVHSRSPSLPITAPNVHAKPQEYPSYQHRPEKPRTPLNNNELPISKHRDEILTAIREHQVLPPI